MPNEDRAAYEAFVTRTLESLIPTGSEELVLAQSIADDRWRLNRAHAIEENVFALGAATNPLDLYDDADTNAALTQAQTFLQNAQQLQLLTLYASRIQRNMNRNLTELRARQDARIVDYDRALEEATLIRQLHNKTGEPWDSEKNGFGFSKAFLDHRIDRQQRLAEARTLFPPAQTAPKRSYKKAA